MRRNGGGGLEGGSRNRSASDQEKLPNVYFCGIRAVAIEGHDVTGRHPIGFSNAKQGVAIDHLVVNGTISLGGRNDYTVLACVCLS